MAPFINFASATSAISGLPYGFPISLLANSYSGHPLLNTPQQPEAGSIDKIAAADKSRSHKTVASTPPPAGPHVATPPPTLPVRSSSPLRCSICEYTTPHKDHLAQHLMAHAAADNRDLANLFGLDQLRMKQQQQQQQQQQQPPPPASAQPTKPSGSAETQVKDYINRMLLASARMASGGLPQTLPAASAAASAAAPLKALDLSRDKEDGGGSSSSSSIPQHKHRRKGQAFKLERSAATRGPPATLLQGECHSPPLSQSAGTPSPPAHAHEEDTKLELEGAAWGGAYQCAYCDIAFKDVVMYTMHMGYHGYQDPFTCNMCGHQTHDKLAFFLHIARSSHS